MTVPSQESARSTDAEAATRADSPPEEPTGLASPPEPTTPALSAPSHDAIEGVTWGVRVAAAWSWRLLFIALAAYVAVRALNRIGLVTFSLILALFLAAVLHPLERRLRAVVPGPRALSAVIALLIGIAVLAAIAGSWSGR
jgi:hypothetical protein